MTSIKKVEQVNLPNNIIKNNTITETWNNSNIVFEEMSDNSMMWTEEYNGNPTTFHEYEDGTRTLDYKKDGIRIIETQDVNGETLNKRVIKSDGEYYTQYEGGKKGSTELQKINNIRENIDISTMEYINGGDEWLADGTYRGESAQYHCYKDGSMTIDQIVDDVRTIYTYDEDGVLQNKREITDETEIYKIYNENGDVIQTETIQLEKPKEKPEVIEKVEEEEVEEVAPVVKEDEISDKISKETYDELTSSGYKIQAVTEIDGQKLITVSKDGENPKIYVENEDGTIKGYVLMGNSSSITDITQNEDGSITINFDNKESITCNMSDINNSITNGQSSIFASAAQKRVIEAAQTTPTEGLGWCEAWAENVLRNAGNTINYHNNAKEAYDNYCTSSNLNDLQVGMIVAIDQHTATPAGSTHGHIGVYVGDGMMMDNVGYIRTMPVSEWMDYYNSYSRNGNSVSWGWMDGINLSQ